MSQKNVRTPAPKKEKSVRQPAPRRQLPELSTIALDVLEQFKSLDPADRCVFLGHAQEFSRVDGIITSKSGDELVEIGDTVIIVSGSSKYLGKTGRVSTARRVRVYVDVNGVDKPVYLFRSDVRKVHGKGAQN